MNKPKILAFAGSTRIKSFNKKLVKNAIRGAESAGAIVTYIDLRDYPLPLYDGDLEKQEGIPENAKRMRELMRTHDGFLIASPEYNSGISGVLKNMIDWTSRPAEGEPSLMYFRGKIAAIMSASPGHLGGLRGLFHLRYVLSNIQVLLLPQQVAVGNTGDAFDENDVLVDEKQRERVEKLGVEVAVLISKLKGE